MKKNLLIGGLVLVLFIGAYFVTENYNGSNVNLSTSKNTAATTEPSLSRTNTDPKDAESSPKATDSSLKDLNGNNTAKTTDSSSPQTNATPKDAEPSEKATDSTLEDSNGNNTTETEESSLPQTNTAQKDTESYEEAADFTLADLNGNTVSLKDFRGKKVYLNFWASWCPPCRREMPDIQKVYEKYQDKDLVVLTVNLGEDKNTVENFINRNNYSFRVLLDPYQSVAQAYDITSIPVSYFIDREGNIVSKRIGAMTLEQMESNIELLGK